MITEKLEESLILMKEELNLKYSDISSFARNIAAKKSYRIKKQTNDENDTQFLDQRIKEWQDWDLKLYQFFDEKLDQKIDKFGKEKMKKAIEQLTQLNKIFV